MLVQLHTVELANLMQVAHLLQADPYAGNQNQSSSSATESLRSAPASGPQVNLSYVGYKSSSAQQDSNSAPPNSPVISLAPSQELVH